MTKIFIFLVGQSCRSALNSWAAQQRRPTEDMKIFVLHPFMISAPVAKSAARTQRKNVIAQISFLREQMEDLNDDLDLLEARARNQGKRTFTRQEVRKQPGIP